MLKATDLLQSGVNWIFRHIPYKKPSQTLLDQVKIIAHRGAWNNTDRIENTMAAFESCLNKDIWAIEFDIRWTQDNVPVVHHDQSLKRLFSLDQNISDLSYLELKNRAPIIPTLESVIKRFSRKIHLMIELKSELSYEQTQILQNLLIDLKPIEDFHFMSLQIEHFKSLHSFSKKTFVSIARMNIKTIFNQTTSQDLGALTGQYLLLTKKMQHHCKTHNILTGTGFPDGKNTFYREVARGIDWIFTNHALELSSLKLP